MISNNYRFMSLVAIAILVFGLSSYGLSSGQNPSKEAGLTGEITSSESMFGNLNTNISSQQFSTLGYKPGDEVRITIGGKEYTLPFVHTYSDVARGKPLLIINSKSMLSIAVNRGSALSFFKVTPPSQLVIQKK
jgi:S-adenosylmethionine hydrolase